MITVEEYDALVQRLRAPISAEHVTAPWASLRAEHLVAHEAVVEAVEDLVRSGKHAFTLREVQRAMDRRFFEYPTRRYQGPCWSTVNNSLRKMAAAGFLHMRPVARAQRQRPRVFEVRGTR